MASRRGRALVALSGGVDSAVAALRLAREGRAAAAVTVRSSSDDDDALDRAERCARRLGLPHYVLDREAEFASSVVEPFVQGYLAGETPNPCVACNAQRLAAFVSLADELGADLVATGHYARVVRLEGEPYLARASDPRKDQSYMLWAVPPQVLARLEFPLGSCAKAEVRAEATEAQLPAADEPESQEVCFAPRGYLRFLEQVGVSPAPGRFITPEGEEVGAHRGHWCFTVGQRRGLGVAAPEPLYVLERRAASNEVVVGPRADLEVREVELRDVLDRGLIASSGLAVKLRYRSAAVAVEAVAPSSAGRVRLLLRDVFSGVAPGQSAVVYRGDVVVGGGIIAGSA